MSNKKLQPIDYTSRDFESIRRDLENYAKRYYPDTYQDFNEASFGSLMLDTVAYIGDILSFYVDYQTNESFMDTAIEYNNVVRLARQMGFKLNTAPSAHGVLTFYIEVPSDQTTLGPSLSYAPRLKAGSSFSSTGGGHYTTLDDVDFSQPTNQVVSGKIDSVTGAPSSYIIRAQARAISGRVSYQEVTLGNFQRFMRVNLEASNVAEILSVVDSEGHIYYEVDNLSQNIIYKAIPNTNTNTRNTVKNLLKAVPVARRFTLEREAGTAWLQFGYGSTSELLAEAVVDPANLVLQLPGRNYTNDLNFDPTKLISTDKFGIAPSNTTLRIGYRTNLTQDVNSGVNTITTVNKPLFRFTNQGSLVQAQRATVMGSLEVSNDEPFVGDISLPNTDEIKQRVYGYFATQNRAVTVQDYQAISYGMPAKFGSIKRAACLRDFDDLRRNLNLYVISENSSGKLTSANVTIKNNLRNWILQYKMVNDTVDILDAAIVNFGISYSLAIDINANRYTVLSKATTALRDYLLRNQYDIGESILITEFYKVLQKVDGVVDVYDVNILGRTGAMYAKVSYDFKKNLSADGRYILADPNVIFELKFANVDIEGAIR
jgi:hypothetical protein